jgi:dipeptidyl aminopeptidase/acylaminoacyl peptidase
MTVDDLWALPRVGTPAPSPDGKRFVVPVTTYSMQTNEPATRLWLDDRPLTTADATSGQPCWSPDARRIAFTRKPGGKLAKFPDQPQLYLMPVDGGEPERLTDLPLGVADPRFFPDGKRIAFLAGVLADAPQDTEKLLKQREEDPVKARVTEDRVYRYWDRWLTDGKVFHIFMLDLETRELTDLTPDSRRWFDLMDPTNQFSISPDGREIAFSATKTDPPHDPILWGVFTVTVATRKTTLLTKDFPADEMHPVYSPDGRWIIFGMQKEWDFYADRVRLMAYDRKARTFTNLTEDWDRSAGGWTVRGNTIYFSAEDEARVAFYTFDLAARKGPRRILRGGGFSSPQVAGDRIYFSRDSLTEPPEVYACGLDGRGLKRLTRFTQPIMSRLQLHTPEEIVHNGVQMWVLHPPGPKGKRPLVHMIHGGPHGIFGDQWHWRWCGHVFGAPGYVVALVNFHGSTSWGQKFAQCIQGSWGDLPYQDIMAATDLLIERGLVDPKRMAATGGSYGGYMASWIAAKTDRFACIINHAGVSDFQTQFASDITQGRKRAFGGDLWEDIEGLDRWNPLRHAAGFKSPMLVLHGERDYRVPYNQALQIYNIYRARKLPARLVCYPDENHWILKPRNSKHWYGEFLGWLDRWFNATRQAKARSRASASIRPSAAP